MHAILHRFNLPQFGKARDLLKLAQGRSMTKALGLLFATLMGLTLAFPSLAVNIETLADIAGPLLPALQGITEMAPSVKALIGFIGFVGALISLAALRNFSPVLFFLGLAIFGGTGLAIAGEILGATLAVLS